MTKTMFKNRMTKAAALFCALLVLVVGMPPVQVKAATVTLTLTVKNSDGTAFNGTQVGAYGTYDIPIARSGSAGDYKYTYATHTSSTRQNGVYANGVYVPLNASGVGTVTVTTGAPVSVWLAQADHLNTIAYHTSWDAGADYAAVTDGIDWKSLLVWTYGGAYHSLYQELGNAGSSNYSATVTFTKINVQPSIIVSARDSVSGSGIQGAVYSYPDLTGATVSATTDYNGNAVLRPILNSTGYTSANITVTEASLPRGYAKSGTPTFTLSTGTFGLYSNYYLGSLFTTGSGHAVLNYFTSFINVGSKSLAYVYNAALDVSNLYITLQDTDTGEPIKSGTFTVASNGATVKTLTTNAIGEATFNQIDNGTYTVTQTGTDTNYSTTTAQNITINKNDGYLTFKNTRKTGTLNVKITDASTGAVIPNAQFVLNGNGTNTIYTTNASGIMTFSGIRYGTYNLNEYSIPSTYTPKALSVSLTLNASTNNATYTYSYNKVVTPTPTYKVFISLLDTDTGEPIRNCSFDFMSGATVLRSLTTNASGEAVYEGAANGTYTVKQTTADGYYNIATATQNAVVNGSDVHVAFKNTRKTGTLNVKITDASSGVVISGAQFILNGNGKNASYTTNASGLMTFSGIRYGTYNLNEYVIPAAYAVKNLSVSLTLDATTNNSTYTYSYNKVPDTAKLYITLQDNDTGEPVRNGKFDVLSGSTVLRSLTANANGEATYEGIANGTYTVKQTDTDANYNVNTTAQSVTVSGNNAYVTFKDTRKTGTLYVKVTDSGTGAGLVNAKFILSGNGRNQTYTTDAAGNITLTGIKYGTYNFNEYEIPTGYISKSLSVVMILDASTNNNTFTYAYNRTADVKPPVIGFDSLPADNSVSSFTQILTLTDDSSGVRELAIDGVTVYTAGAAYTVLATYSHIITANKTYQYTLMDYAGNVYTASQTVKSILYKPLQLSDPRLSNYKTTVSYAGASSYVISAAYSYSNVYFDVTGEDTEDGFTCLVELLDEGGRVMQQADKALTVSGSVTDRVFYQDSVTGQPVADGVYSVRVTVKDKYNSVNKSVPVIVKRNSPPRPVIAYASDTGTAAIDYPADLFEALSEKQYVYLDGTKDYAGSFTVTKSGTVTATYTDVAGNKSTAMLSVTPPRLVDPGDGSDGGGTPIPTPNPNGNGSGSGGLGGTSGNSKYGTGSMMEETRNCIIYYVNLRGNYNDPDVINAILSMID